MSVVSNQKPELSPHIGDRLWNYVTEPSEFHEYTTELFELIQSGKLDIAIHDEYPFTTEGIRQTQIDITGRGTSGKLVVKVAP